MRGKFLLSIPFIFLFFSNLGFAQECEPAEELPPNAIVFPLPFSDSNPDGGITDTAVLNQYFEFAVTIDNPGEFNGIPFESIELTTEGAISNLPSGMDYICNPPNCIIGPMERGCILLFGTPDDPADVGVHDLTITGILRLAGGTTIPVTFPGSPGLPSGNYFLFVNETVSTQELLRASIDLESRPNPTAGLTQILVTAENADDFDFLVTDVLGKVVHRRTVSLMSGENTIEFNAGNLAPGMYHYVLRNELGAVAERLIISRR